MVTAIVGANWGDEGKGKITDMLGEDVSREEVTQGIRLSMIMANLHYIFCRPACFTIIRQVLLETAWH